MSYQKLKDDNLEKLIELVNEQPGLYDKSQKDYKNKQKSDVTWQKFGAELEISGMLFTYISPALSCSTARGL